MKFQLCKKIGIYPIVDSSDLVKLMFENGAVTVQLRIKNKDRDFIESEIKKSVEISKKYPNSQFFVNDEWELAIEYGAFGVHLGQEDVENLLPENIEKICKYGLRLGISTHNADEINYALEFQPSYLAIGPIFSTKSKNLPYECHGIEGFKEIRKKLDYPLVAIAGINLENGVDLINAGVDGIAVMSDITKNPKPDKRVQEWIKIFEKNL
jgi:hydroxymethylpyrimidine kinase/phosphomethylpyrimidine kinase/thiamine-phosphate diphosphorylase